MSREIEFRAKTTMDNKWVYGGYYSHLFIDQPPTFIHDGYRYAKVDPRTLGQYICTIGEQKIYEGDILVLSNEQAYPKIVYFDNDKLAYCLHEIRYGSYWGKLSNAFRLQVSCIGNIHDNPELLE